MNVKQMKAILEGCNDTDVIKVDAGWEDKNISSVSHISTTRMVLAPTKQATTVKSKTTKTGKVKIKKVRIAKVTTAVVIHAKD